MILKYWFEKISSSVWFFVCVTKKEYILNVLLTCIFMPWLLDSLDQPRHGSESSDIPRCTHRLISKIDYSSDQWSVVSFVIKKLFLYLFMVKECIFLVIQMYFMQIYFYFLWFGNKFTDFCVFAKLLLTLHTRWNIKENKILRKFKTQFEGSQFKSDYEQQTFVL